MKEQILLLFAIFTFNVSFAQWVEIDINTNETLHEIYFVNNDIGYIVGNNGQLFRTSDGGDNWSSINTGTSLNLFTISFANNNVGFINGLKTTDGGLTWAVQSASEEFGLIYALDDNNLIAALADNFSGDIYKSSDGGDNWQVIANPIFPLTGAYNDACFINDEVGYLSAWYSDHLVKTVDGGETWTEIIIDEVDGANFISDDYRSVDFFSEELGLVTHQNGILKTLDGGNTWSEIKPNNLNLSFYPENIIALSSQNYIVVGGFENNGFEKIYETSDGGATWMGTVNVGEALKDVECNMTYCFAVGTNGKIFKKENIINNVSEGQNLLSFLLYPNPSQEILHIKTDSEIESIKIFNLNGKLIKSFSPNNYTIDISDLNSGIHLIEIISDDGVSIKKVMKE